MTAPTFSSKPISTTPYCVSFNDSIINRPSDDVMESSSAHGWTSTKCDAATFIENVSNGIAYSAHFIGGHRKTTNFQAAGFIAADFDGTLTLEEATKNYFIKSYASFIHTTGRHTPEINRFRVVFLLAEPIEPSQDWADALLGLAVQFGSDENIKDAGRMFFGNDRAEITLIGNTLPADEVGELQKIGSQQRATKNENRSSLTAISAPADGSNLQVRTAAGARAALNDLPALTPIYCPQHDDKNPSAFTVRSRQGVGGFHCSVCRTRFFPKEATFDFAEFDRLFDERISSPLAINPSAPGLSRYFPPEPTCHKISMKHLEPISYSPGLMLVKSPKGSGKTEALKSLLDQLRSQQFRSDLLKDDRPNSVLLIGHRTALLREAAHRLGLHFYQDAERIPEKVRSLAVCLDSLPKFEKDEPYDVVIIDESEQVFSHLLSSSLQSRPAALGKCYDALEWFLSRAKAVICLDADLSMLTANVMRTLRASDWKINCHIIYNKPAAPSTPRVIRLHRQARGLHRELIDAVKGGNRCFLTTNSKKATRLFERMIRDNCGNGVRIRVINSDNSRGEEEVHFVNNITTEILRIQVLIASPSLGTGIDISFTDGACEVHRVFGFFHTDINTHFEIDQQLARVRNPGAVDVWISPTRLNYNSNMEVIKYDLAQAHTVERALTSGRDENGGLRFDADNPLLTICAQVTAMQHASKNDLLNLFVRHRVESGWTIEEAELPVEERSMYGEAKKSLWVDWLKLLKAMPDLDSADYIDLDSKIINGALLSQEERATHEKNRFLHGYGLQPTEQLFELNKDGRLHDRIALFRQMWTLLSDPSDRETVMSKSETAGNPQKVLTQTGKAELLGILLASAGLVTSDKGLSIEKELEPAHLTDFIGCCIKNKTLIEMMTNCQVRADLAKNPVRQLGDFLRLIGLRMVKAGERKSGNAKIRRYRINAGLFTTIHGAATRPDDRKATLQPDIEEAEHSIVSEIGAG
jgi:hypothetical protein